MWESLQTTLHKLWSQNLDWFLFNLVHITKLLKLSH
jgi:hypothetical protein